MYCLYAGWLTKHFAIFVVELWPDLCGLELFGWLPCSETKQPRQYTEDMRLGGWSLGLLLFTTFAVGFFSGYKAKEWRVRFLRRRRDRLADQLYATQRRIEDLKSAY